MELFTFEHLPKLVADLKTEVKEMKALLLQKAEPQPEINNPIGIKDVAKLTGLTVPTLYRYCQQNEIPYQKKGNRLYFFREEIVAWIKTGRQKTLREIKSDSDTFFSNKKKAE